MPFYFQTHKGTFSIPLEYVVESRCLLYSYRVVFRAICSTAKSSKLITISRYHTKISLSMLDAQWYLCFHLNRLVLKPYQWSLHRFLKLADTSAFLVVSLSHRVSLSITRLNVSTHGALLLVRSLLWIIFWHKRNKNDKLKTRFVYIQNVLS